MNNTSDNSLKDRDQVVSRIREVMDMVNVSVNCHLNPHVINRRTVIIPDTPLLSRT